jgi:asparagine synthase (glutamine-hydrolysing)
VCGLTGFLDLEGGNPLAALTQDVERMTATLISRGPDDCGIWVDEEQSIAVGHRRLSILDLSAHGHQPMVSACGRFVIAFNGEIYNHHGIRAELEAIPGSPGWRGHSDTEVLLAAIACWGVRETLDRLNGMFAFALWDRRDRLLHLARDRLGEKPLYYGLSKGVLLFGSELKALRAFRGWRGEVNRDAIALFLRHSYIPCPYSIYEGIYKLPPAGLLTLSAEELRSGRFDACTPERVEMYWDARAVAEGGARNRLVLEDDEAISLLEKTLTDAVGLRMEADVPLGAFLSGGIDSSAVVALMQVQSSRPVKTFSIGFHEARYNEATYANAVARHLGTDHTELYVTPEEAMGVIPRLPHLYDEPFGDSSQIPTFLVSQLARREVIVSLSGDGGDELFGGYHRYFWARRMRRMTSAIPVSARKILAKAIWRVPTSRWDTVLTGLGPVLPKRLRVARPGDRLHKAARALSAESTDELYRLIFSHWDEPEAVVVGATEPESVIDGPARKVGLEDFVERMMYSDMVAYLPDDIMVKLDRASMGVSLESRVPLLDHNLVELAWRFPISQKIRDGQGKWLLRQVLYRHVPQRQLERPKMGFGVPIDEWLRGPLRDWAESLLDERRLRDEGYFDPQPIRRLWREHLAGGRNWQYYLWDVLMFQTWLETQ